MEVAANSGAPPMTPLYPADSVQILGSNGSIWAALLSSVTALVKSDGDIMAETPPEMAWEVVAIDADGEAFPICEIPNDVPWPVQRERAMRVVAWLTEWLAYRPAPFLDARAIPAAIDMGTTVEWLVREAVQELEGQETEGE